MLRAWSLSIVTITLIGHTLIMCAQYIHCVFSQTTALILSLHLLCHSHLEVQLQQVNATVCVYLPVGVD